MASELHYWIFSLKTLMEEQLRISNANDFIFLLMLWKYIAASAPLHLLKVFQRDYWITSCCSPSAESYLWSWVFISSAEEVMFSATLVWLLVGRLISRITQKILDWFFTKLGWRMCLCPEETPLAFGLILIICNSIKHLKILKTDHI